MNKSDKTKAFQRTARGVATGVILWIKRPTARDQECPGRFCGAASAGVARAFRRGEIMSDPSKSAGKNAEVSRAVRLALAAALLGAATVAGAQDLRRAKGGARVRTSKKRREPVSGPAQCRAGGQEGRCRRARLDPGRGHRQISRFQSGRIDAAHPRVAITRDAGEGRNLSVRGLGAQFTRVRINGMEAMSTTGGTDSSGGTNRNRQFDFNVFASELFNNLTARKTQSSLPGMAEGSLGATVDLYTARPFDFQGIHHGGRLQGRLQRPAGRRRSARHFSYQRYLRRREIRRAVLGGLRAAQPRRGRPEHGSLGSRQQRRRLQRRQLHRCPRA